MSKRVTLYLARLRTGGEVGVFRKPPRFRTIPAVPARPCRCEPTCTYIFPGRPEEKRAQGYALVNLCASGVKRAGLPVKDGEIVELTITAKPVKPKTKKRK